MPLSKINSILILEFDVVRDLSFNELKINLGFELTHKNMISGRLGRCGDRLTLGAGLRYRKLIFDYGLITHSDLGISNKFSAGLDF